MDRGAHPLSALHLHHLIRGDGKAEWEQPPLPGGIGKSGSVRSFPGRGTSVGEG